MMLNVVGQRVELVREESHRLGEYLAKLTPETMSAQSACARWNVAHVAAHLAFVAQLQIRMIARGLTGDDSPPEGAVRRNADASPASELIAQGAISLRERLGDQLVSTFHTRYEELLQVLDSLKQEDLHRPCWHPRGPTTIAEYVGLAVQEIVLHGWDIRSCLDPDYHLNLAVLPVALDLAPNRLQRSFRPDLQPTSHAHYRFDVEGSHPPDLVVEGKILRVEPEGENKPDVVLRCDGETYVLLLYGRLSSQKAISAGRMTFTGPRKVALQYSNLFHAM